MMGDVGQDRRVIYLYQIFSFSCLDYNYNSLNSSSKTFTNRGSFSRNWILGSNRLIIMLSLSVFPPGGGGRQGVVSWLEQSG